MLVDHIVRGNTVLFTASFLDADGAAIVPAAVTLYVSFLGASGRESDEIAMDEATDGSFSASWDSSDARKGRVYWAVRASNPPGADEGFFELDAGPANPDAA